jgi:hypothetical protein
MDVRAKQHVKAKQQFYGEAHSERSCVVVAAEKK